MVASYEKNDTKYSETALKKVKILAQQYSFDFLQLPRIIFVSRGGPGLQTVPCHRSSKRSVSASKPMTDGFTTKNSLLG